MVPALPLYPKKCELGPGPVWALTHVVSGPRVGGAAASQAWAKHERRERRLPVVILRALVVRGRAVARRDSSCTDAWKRSLRFVANALDERQSSSDDEADDRKRARVLVCNEGPFRHVVSFL